MKSFFTLLLALFVQTASAQMPPMFMGGPPGLAQFQAITLQRHQARTLLYREAIEELRKNPQAADVPVCVSGVTPERGECILPPITPEKLGTAAPALPPAPVVATAPAVQATPAAVAAPAVVSTPAQPAGRRIALLIGNNAYSMPIPALDTPVADVMRIAKVLDAQFGYRSVVLKNAGKEATIAALNRLGMEVRPEDSVFIFYAGHGYQMDDTGMGYWIPVDASVKTAKGWVANDDIARLLAAIPARQIILISDSCFSGTLAKERKLQSKVSLDPQDILRRRSVLVMTSGDEEPVSDEGKEGHSIFAWNLVRTLETSGEMVPGYEVWRNVHRGVTKDYPQTPQYGAVISAGHAEGGEYLF